jgi:hypothetical protein
MQRKDAGFHPEADQSDPKQRSHVGPFAHRPEIPSSGARGERAEESEETDRAHMRSHQI